MDNRKALLDYVRNGGSKAICSPQIGAGAGFDTKLAGKTWITDTVLEDTIRAWEAFDVIPLYNFGLPDITRLAEGVKVQTQSYFDEAKAQRVTRSELITGVGRLDSLLVEEELKGCVMLKHRITLEEELPILEYYLDALLDITDFSSVSDGVSNFREAIGSNNAMDIQWAMQPYELFGFPSTMDTAIFALTCPEIFKRLMDKILKLNERLLPVVADGGADFVFLGGPGSEMISPAYYENFLVPYSKIISEIAHSNGLLIYSHICSPIEPMLSKGYYNDMGLDLFETLSAPPVGNIKSLADAFSKLSPDICTRGNIGLDILLNGTPAEIRTLSLDILETARVMGRKHILAASDYMFYQTPPENVQAMVDAANEFNARH